ncbi:transposable element Tc1 transposase [Trichonephila clavipes]|nr:transposable element Tc1 transposase [Trichonephila clavipes]
MAVNDSTASFKQLAARWSTATGVLMSAASIYRRLLHRGLRARVPLYRIPLTANQRRVSLQWAHKHRACQVNWHQVVFSDESRFHLWGHDGHISVRRYASERCLPECVMERHSGVMRFRIMDDPICYELRVISIATGSSVMCYNPKSFPSIKASSELSFSNNALPHVAKTVRDFCSTQHIQLFPRPAHSSDMSPIEHEWDLVGRRLARVPHPAASKDGTFAAHTSNMEFFSISRHSKSV